MRYVALILVLLLAVSPAVGGAVDTSHPTHYETRQDLMPGPGPADTGTLPSSGRLGSTDRRNPEKSLQFETPTVNFTIDLRTNRTARWTVVMRYEFSDAADREAFREFATGFENGRTEGTISIAPFRNAARVASNATGRQMDVRDVDRTSTVRNASGTLKLSFTWTNFVRRTDQGLRVGDAFATPDNGTWLSALGPNQRLVITPPSGYVVDSSNYRIENQRVIIEGPTTFEDDNRIRISYLRAENPGIEPVVLIAGGGVVLLLGLLGGYVLLRGRESRREGGPTGGETPSTTGDSNAGDAVESQGSGGQTEAASTGADQEDLTLLSDEERVERLLERNGGRMRQADIVDETGWSDAKVSQLLSSMAEEGRVDKLRLGRENLISLPDGDDNGNP